MWVLAFRTWNVEPGTRTSDRGTRDPWRRQARSGSSAKSLLLAGDFLGQSLVVLLRGGEFPDHLGSCFRELAPRPRERQHRGDGGGGKGSDGRDEQFHAALNRSRVAARLARGISDRRDELIPYAS